MRDGISPANMKYLLHCYCVRSPYDQYRDVQFHDFCIENGIIEPAPEQPFTGEPTIFKTTLKGCFWVEAMLAVRIPVQRFEIPKEDEGK